MQLTLELLPGDFAVCRLDAADAVPAWVREPALAAALGALAAAGHSVPGNSAQP